MASILRSSKFVRYIAGFARNVVLNTPREFDGNLVNTTQCLCGAIPRSLATQATTSAHHDQNLDLRLKNIDQDVRKAGRISIRDVEDVLEEIRNAKSASSSQSLLVIRCCGNLVPEETPEVRTKLVQEIWNTFNKLNIPLDISHYNALLRVYLENEYDFSPTEFLSELESNEIEPNRVTYQRLIARYCQKGDIEGATKILEYMREKQLPVNENVFNALIVGHSQSGDMESAHGILTVMNQAGLEPSADTYATLICGYAQKGDIDTILKLFDECESKEIYFVDKDYLEMVNALAINGHPQHIPVILGKTHKAFGYNQDAINVIYRLLNKGLDEAAFLVLKSMTKVNRFEGNQTTSGIFFIRHLVKADMPLEKILKYVDLFESENMYPNGLLKAAEMSLAMGKDKLSYVLLEELQKRGTEIRQHFFWPLLVAKGKDGDSAGVLNVVKEMKRFNLTPSAETVRDYVIPNLEGESSKILALLREVDISVGSSAASLVFSLLERSEISEAAVIAKKVWAYYAPETFRRPMATAFYKTKDLKSYMTIVRCIYDNLDKAVQVVEEESKSQIDKVETVGSFLWELAQFKRSFLNHAEEVLQAFVDTGYSISTTTAEKIQDTLGENMTDKISELLGRLSSGELNMAPLEKKQPSYVPSNKMTIPQLERLVDNLEAKGQEVLGLKRQLLTLYYRDKNIKKTEALLAKMPESFIYTSGVYAQLLALYSHHENLEKATEYLNKLKEIEGESFRLDESKIVRYAGLFIKNGNLEEGLKIVENIPRERKSDERNFAYTSFIWRLLNSLAEEGKVEEINKLFDALVKKEFLDVTNIILGPLVKVHLVRNELDKALEKLEWCVNQFKATPWKNELACRLIQAEDAEKLQKLTDLSTSVHGEINSLYDLVFAFVECGRVRQARKILETPGLQSRPQRINSACERYRQEGLVKPLEGLKDATKDLNHIDRSDIYMQLLLSYIKQEDLDKAVGLWEQMQEEDLAPTEEFLVELGNFLRNRGEEVPFAIPTVVKVQTEEEAPALPQQKTTYQVFREMIKTGKIDEALRFKHRSKENFLVTDVSMLIEKLVQSDRLFEAKTLAIEILNRNNMPVNRVFRFLLSRLASTGEIGALEEIGSKISQEAKKMVSFDNRVCHANLVAGRGEEYLKSLEDAIDSAEDGNLNVVAERFPRGGAYGILEKHPELAEKFETLAIKYAKKGILGPLNVLWTEAFCRGDDEKANYFWQTYLKDVPRIMFQRILHSARDHKDESLARKLIHHLKSSNVTNGALGNAYSCLLDILVANEKYEDVVPTFEAALKEVPVDNVNRTAVLRVKEVYDKLGKPFNYKIPLKNNKSSTSSSSSSSEKNLKK